MHRVFGIVIVVLQFAHAVPAAQGRELRGFWGSDPADPFAAAGGGFYGEPDMAELAVQATQGDDADLPSDLAQKLAMSAARPARNLPSDAIQGANQADCGGGANNPDPKYSPANGNVIELNLVVHVAYDPSFGKYYTKDEIVEIVAQTNEHYAGKGYRGVTDYPAGAHAPDGGNRVGGVDTKIRWRLATEDENGEATDGVIFHENAVWYRANAAMESEWNA